VEPKAQLGRNLRQFREAAGLTQMELGNRTGMDMAEISRLELGKRDPRLSTIVRVAVALELTAAELVHGVGPST
jgi:transcriptional regulator with XRE-family HTH domain